MASAQVAEGHVSEEEMITEDGKLIVIDRGKKRFQDTLGNENNQSLPKRGKTNGTFPINKTLISNQQRTIVIKPIGEQSNKLLTDPVGLAKALDNSKFKEINNKELRLNRRRNILALEIKEETVEIEKFLEVSELGKWRVKCYVPGNNRGNSVSVVIKPIHHDVDLEELKEMIKTRES